MLSLVLYDNALVLVTNLFTEFKRNCRAISLGGIVMVVVCLFNGTFNGIRN